MTGTLPKRIIDRAAYRLLGAGWAAWRARRSWNRHAHQDPRDATAAHDSGDWETYWRSGYRDFELILSTARAAGLKMCEDAIEIGCGLGRLTRVAAAHFRQVVGLDISQEMLALAAKESARPNTRYLQIGTDLRLPVHEAVADLVFAWTVFRHVSKETFAHYLDEGLRILKPGGFLVFEAQIRESGRPAEPFPTEPYTEREYTRAELEGYCHDHGFAWGSDREIPSITPDTFNLILGWQKPKSRG